MFFRLSAKNSLNVARMQRRAAGHSNCYQASVSLIYGQHKKLFPGANKKGTPLRPFGL